MSTNRFLQALAAFVLLVAVGLAGSCLARSYREHRRPKPTPPIVDPGKPADGPIATSPTVDSCLPIARPDLSEAEVRALAVKYGLDFARKPGQERRSGAGAVHSDAPNADDSGAILEPLPANVLEMGPNPFPLAEEIFRHEPSGAALAVSAWYMGAGERVDLRGSWSPWSPPAPVQTGGGGIVGIGRGSRFRIGAGGIATEQGVGAGPVGGWNYDGFRILGASATADVCGGWSNQSGGVALGMLGVSF